MFFNSFQFAGFFLCVWLLLLALRRRALRRVFPRIRHTTAITARNTLILGASYLFYSVWDVRFLILIFASTLVDFYCGRRIHFERTQAGKRFFLVASLISNLGILGFFKYYDFFASSLAALANELGFRADPALLHVVLPVGVSFYTFQSIGYIVDVYRGKTRAELNLLVFAVFVAFFPQLVAGPIERAGHLLPQFRHTRVVTAEKLALGAHLIATGLFKKVVIADNLAPIADAAFALKDPTLVPALIGAYAFTFQIYCDFSGYSDIARGTARCMGFDLSLNFDLPYVSRTPSEFWRRWHISLSTWLRDYLYVSLGGNRRGPWRTYLNLLLTMFLGGLWHGASWTFVVWGLFHGVILCAYRAISEPVTRLFRKNSLPYRLGEVVAAVAFFHLVCVGWILFRADSLNQAGRILGALAIPTADPATSLSALGAVDVGAALVLLLVLAQVFERARGDLVALFHLPAPVRGILYSVATALFVWIGKDGGEAFIYFQF